MSKLVRLVRKEMGCISRGDIGYKKFEALKDCTAVFFKQPEQVTWIKENLPENEWEFGQFCVIKRGQYFYHSCEDDYGYVYNEMKIFSSDDQECLNMYNNNRLFKHIDVIQDDSDFD